MTTRQIHQAIGHIEAETSRLCKELAIADHLAEFHGSPTQGQAIARARQIRRELSGHYTRLHDLRSLLPTPETLSEAAYNRALMLGLEADAAEAARRTTYRDNLALTRNFIGKRSASKDVRRRCCAA